jgi:hypothetical protein
MYSMHPFGGLSTHPFGGSMSGLPIDMNTSVKNTLKTSNVAKAALNTQLLKQQVNLLNQLRASSPVMRQGAAMSAIQPMMGTGAEGLSFWDQYKNYILIGGAVAAVGVIALVMRRK